MSSVAIDVAHVSFHVYYIVRLGLVRILICKHSLRCFTLQPPGSFKSSVDIHGQ